MMGRDLKSSHVTMNPRYEMGTMANTSQDFCADKSDAKCLTGATTQYPVVAVTAGSTGDVLISVYMLLGWG